MLPILWQLRLRCAGYLARGFLFWGPAPYHADWRCFARGQAVTATCLLLCVPVLIFAAGFAVGRYL